MSGQTPFEGEGDWGDPVPPQTPPPAPGARPPAAPVPSGAGQSPPSPYQGGDSGYQEVSPPRPSINNFLIPAIASTLLCCPPTGIAAIVFASQVNTKLSQGDVAGAQASASKAKTWTYVTVGAGVVVGILWFLSVLASSGSSY